MKKITVPTLVAAVAGVLSLLYYLICGILYSFSLSGLWIWLGFSLIMGFAVLWKLVAEPRIPESRLYVILKSVCIAVFAVFMGVFLLFECCIIGRWIHGCGDSTADTVIVLGATVEGDSPGDTLRVRILTAYEYLTKNPDATLIACGGLGEGDFVTEADCIKDELIRLGIDGDRIITESRSTSTNENFLYAAELIPHDAERIAIVTSGFHQFRAFIIGEYHLGSHGDVTLIPVSAGDIAFSLPHSMVREFAAMVSDLTEGNVRIGQ